MDVHPFSQRCVAKVLKKRINVTEDPWEYISCFYGPQTQELYMAVLITVTNAIVFVSGILGNIGVCIVIAKNPSLHTATNYYLFNLAVSDLTLLIFGLPYDVSLYWHQYPWFLGETMCKIRALISEMSSYVSVMTVVAFSTERYIAIRFPLYLRHFSGFRRVIWIIAGLWIISFFCALPFAIFSTLNYVHFPPNTSNVLMESSLCAMTKQPEYFPLTEVSSIIFFIAPMLIILVEYSVMGLHISKSTGNNFGRKFNGSLRKSCKNAYVNRNVIRMLFFVVIGFFMCWAPFHAQRLMAVYFEDSENIEEISYWMYFISGLFYYFSSTLNPILYNVMSVKMRKSFQKIFCAGKNSRTKKCSMISRSTRSSHQTISTERKINEWNKRDSLCLFMHNIDQDNILV